MNKTRGLILGKFAPFHIGHQRLVEIALKEVDEVYIIIYDCPNLTSIPLDVRANWIRYFFPQVHVIEGWDAPNRHEDTPAVKRLQEEYVKKALNGKKVTHFFSSEYYGEHMSKFLGAIDRRTNRDDPREGYGMYATIIRNGSYAHRQFLSKIVYKDILIKVAFIGMPSKEQSRLVRSIAKILQTTYVGDNLEKVLDTKHIEDKKVSINFYDIARERYKKANSKDKIFSGKGYLIYDSTGFVDHLLSVATHNRFNEELYRFFSDDMRNYDLVFISDNKKSSIGKYFHIDHSIFLNQLISNLNTVGIDYKILTGTFKEKLLRSGEIIKAVKKKFN